MLRVLPSLPLTPNGKVDRPALEALAADLLAERGAPEEPADDVERRLADLWSRVLGAPVEDRAANFFALGGTSLLALRMITEVRGALHPGVSTRAFLADPTLRALADQLRGAGDDAVVVGTI
ncbi:phosphopantetheine-binding protein [Rothia santali]|uniref:phosphopantetheine-binding protein n=1 Tax=Rothia santali TaxID=2949643 RepID=UPI0035A0148F